MQKRKIISSIVIILMPILIIGCGKVAEKNNNEKDTNNTQVETGKATATPTEKTKEKNIINNESSEYKNLDLSKSPYKAGYYDYEGTINDKLKIRMSFYNKGDKLVGTYFYESQNKYINIEGKADDKSVILFELGADGKSSAVFEGNMEADDKIVGTWNDGTQKLSLSMKLTDIIPGVEYGKRYSMATKVSDSDVEKFVRNIQAFVNNNDKSNVAKSISYPVNVNIKGERTLIKNEEDFIKNYDSIFTSEYKKAIKDSFAKYLLVNTQGVMIGDGLMWFNGATPEDRKSMKITAIN